MKQSKEQRTETGDTQEKAVLKALELGSECDHQEITNKKMSTTGTSADSLETLSTTEMVKPSRVCQESTLPKLVA